MHLCIERCYWFWFCKYKVNINTVFYSFYLLLFFNAKVALIVISKKEACKIFLARFWGYSRSNRLVLFEYREVDAAVASMLYEARMLGEIVVLAMLEHEDTILIQEVAIQY